MKKENFIDYTNKTFKGIAKDLVLNQIELFYEKPKFLNKTIYKEGEEVFLKKNTFIHGIFGNLENFDFTISNGFISTDFTSNARENKICNSVGMWKIKEDIRLKDYINLYSGFTITYSIGRGPNAITKSKLIPYHKFDEMTETINNDDNIWTYWGTKTKEVSFLPSLVSEKRQIAFIINTESDYAKKLIEADIWNLDLTEEELKYFIDYRYLPKFLNERKNKDASTTDREAAIIFGIPNILIEGVFVGRKIENDKTALKYIKNQLPECYICNLDGRVITGNN